MASLGAHVLMIDLVNVAKDNFNAAVAAGAKGTLSFLQKDFGKLKETDVPDGLDILYSQRALHYLRYKDAAKCLKMIFGKMATGGAAFISVAGMGCEFGTSYPDRAKPVQRRFNKLAPDMQAKYNTQHKLVLYTEAETRVLLEDAGFSGITFIPSNFGNIRACAFKK